MSNQYGEQLQFDRQVVASSVAMSTGVSFGYVLWLIRGGALLSSIVASMPAWRSIDPLPVLATLNGADSSSDDDDSLESMLDRAKEPTDPIDPADSADSERVD